MSRKKVPPRQLELLEQPLPVNLPGPQVDGSAERSSKHELADQPSHPFADEAGPASPSDDPHPKPTQVRKFPPRPPPEVYLSVHDLCERYHVSKATIWRWVKDRPGFPKPIKLSPGTTRWRLSELVEFEENLGNPA
ncbi:MAG: AlpA family phage regulatory protein [Hyphomicrobiales bacterium]|nr:AlpA family phage regulatory protein [Hyphomicrobiales bacterium]